MKKGEKKKHWRDQDLREQHYGTMQRLQGLREKLKTLPKDPRLTEEQRKILETTTSMLMTELPFAAAAPTEKEMKAVVERMLKAARNESLPGIVRRKKP